MQHRSAQVRINKWIDKFSGERQGVTALLSIDTAIPVITKAYNEAVSDERRARIILIEAAVPRYQFPYYLNFTRQIRGLINQGFSGASLIATTALILAKYVSYGLLTDNLEKIRNDVFAIAAPPAP